MMYSERQLDLPYEINVGVCLNAICEDLRNYMPMITKLCSNNH